MGRGRLRTFALGLTGSLAIMSAPLAAEVVETRDDGFVTRDTASVAATPLETWLALIRPGDWWNDDHTWSADASNMTLVPQAGGCFCEKVPGEDGEDGFSLDGSVQHGTVIQAYPLRVLRIRGGLGPLQGEPASGIITITLKEIEGGTRILWEYNVGGSMRFEIPMISEAVDGVMTQQLHGLQAHLGALEGDEDSDDEEADAAPNDGEAAEAGEEPSVEEQVDAMGGDS